MITGVTIEMTTHCNRRCPDCCAGVGINRVLQHHDWEYFERAAKALHGIERVNLTGGEPTAHPRFAEYVSRFKELFGCKRLTLSTNGYRVKQHIEVIKIHFDSVDFSDYGDNLSALRLLCWYGIEVNVYQAGLLGINFTPRSKRGTGSCFRACAQSGMVAYADGKLYGCCVAPGITGAQGIDLWANWRDIIETAKLPCADCWFAT